MRGHCNPMNWRLPPIIMFGLKWKVIQIKHLRPNSYPRTPQFRPKLKSAPATSFKEGEGKEAWPGSAFSYGQKLPPKTAVGPESFQLTPR
jgi:hypothetical protein